MQPLNSPLELGLRTLVVLTTAFPRTFDLDRLVLLDYCLLHSADLEGPPSVLPAVPNRSGELGLKRTVLDHGVQLMARAGMVDLVTTAEGMTYRAGEEAAPFLRLLESPLLGALGEVATWAVDEFGDLNTDQVRDRLRTVSESWATEFAWEPTDEEGMVG
ncbi:ABC-three component system middle component 2 [Nocardioides lacusdianchii]|uniref:ABC-three component system middle component 2 n=1 Tax=Nocardioides lacusdianchii TaxID=2783664 RepID=UPI001CCCA066|nr:ABC-three component system middle component 2 [Nocardioides lacusdianchii]